LLVAGALAVGGYKFFPVPPPSTDDSASVGWDRMNAILARSQPPTFADRDFSVLDFGAVGDGVNDCTGSIKSAIEACNNAGGGRVVVPTGHYRTGPIHLLSNVNLHVARGATLLFSTNPNHYMPVVFSRWEGVECMNYSPLVYAYKQENVAVTGEGTLDGQADNEYWWPWRGDATFGYRQGQPTQDAFRARLISMASHEIPPAKRIMGEGSQLRPSFIQPYLCNNVLIEGVTVKRSPMWAVHPVLCKNVIVREVTIISAGPNADALVPESCSDVVIESCTFDTNSDCISLKSGRNQDGRRIDRPVENVVIRNCLVKDGKGAIVIGSEVSGGARDIYVENYRVESSRLERFLRVKTNSVRGGTIENVYIRDVRLKQASDAVLLLNLYYDEGDTGRHAPLVRNIHLNRVSCQKSKFVAFARGYKRAPIRDIFFTDCEFDNAELGNVLENVEGMYACNVFINGEDFQPDAVIAEVASFAAKRDEKRGVMPLPSQENTFDSADPYTGVWEVTKGDWSFVEENGNGVYAGVGVDENRAESGESSWMDYRVEARVKVDQLDENNRLLVCGRLQDGNNYYAAAIAKRSSGLVAELHKKADKQTQIVARLPIQMTMGRWHKLALEMRGEEIGVCLDGEELIAVHDQTFTQGKVGLMTFRSQAQFDDVSVTQYEADRHSPARLAAEIAAIDSKSTLTQSPVHYGFDADDMRFWNPSKGAWTLIEEDKNPAYASGEEGEYRAVAGGPSWTDYRVETRVKVAAGGDNSRVLLCGRFVDGNNYYAASLSHRDSGSLVEFIKKENMETFRLTSVPIPVEKEAWHLLGLEMKGNEIRIDFNGKVLIDATDDSFTRGGIGLLTVRAQGLFDDVTVTLLKGQFLEPDRPGAESAPAAVPRIMESDFEQGGAAGWKQTKGAWTIQNDGGNMVYASIGRTENRSETGDPTWTDYRVETRIKLTGTQDDNRTLLCGRFQDGNNYYAASIHLDGSGSELELLEKQNGQNLTISRAPIRIETGAWYRVALELKGSSIRVYFEGAPLIVVSDDSFASGGIGLITMQAQAMFDDVRVAPLETPSELTYLK
jgi:polygalacturonase